LLASRQVEMLKAAAQCGWKISPLATAVALSARDAQPYKPYKHLRIISDKIRRAVSKGGGRLIFSMPPQHGKSQTVSKWTPIWALENWPHWNIINAGYGKDFAKDWGRTVRNTVARHKGTLSYELSQDSTRADYWHTDKGGSMLCAGVGSGITGKPCQLFIIDDPIKGHAEAASFVERQHVWEWYVSEARTRIHKGTTIILVMTRWNEDDLAGRLLKKNTEGWEIVNLPAIYDDKAAQQGPDPLGRNIGEALCPELHDLDDLRAQMQNSEEVWQSLYQGRPGTTAGLGNVYGSFDERYNIRPCDRDPGLRLVLTVDFNVDPMCGLIMQYKEFYGAHSHITNEKYAIVEVLDEVCLPDTNTEEWSKEWLSRARKICGNYDVDVEIHGDPAGKSRHTSQVAGSDYDIIKDVFRGNRQFNVKYCVKKSAPAIKDRVNSVNKMFKNALGEHRLMIDPRCTMLKRDLQNVRWKRDSSGNTTGQLEKSQKDLTHISDALGYFIEAKFGRLQGSGEQDGLLQ
jgi:hypothetical protein